MGDSPRQIGLDENIVLTGCLMPWSDETNQPAFVFVIGESKPCIPLFTDQKKLNVFSEDFGLMFDRVKHIDDGFEFLDSIPKEVDIIYNPRKHEDKVRYKLVKR